MYLVPQVPKVGGRYMYQIGELPQTRLCRCKATYKMGDILVASTVEVGGAQSDCKATPTAGGLDKLVGLAAP